MTDEYKELNLIKGKAVDKKSQGKSPLGEHFLKELKPWLNGKGH